LEVSHCIPGVFRLRGSEASQYVAPAAAGRGDPDFVFMCIQFVGQGAIVAAQTAKMAGLQPYQSGNDFRQNR
jgi:hypothetical protein